MEYVKRNSDRHLSELKEFLAIPTISTLSAHKPDMIRGAEWVSRKLAQIGFRNVEIMATGGHPVVYGEWLQATGKPTVLFYGHYDVQPVDPVAEWVTPPFEPTIRDGNIYARGASDMKGNGVAVVEALEAWMRNGGLPVNVKVLFEGEEEVGSPHLEAFLESHKQKLKCDVFLSADAEISNPNLPSLAIGARGLLYVELWVYGPASDLHSGGFGGAVQNPATVLCELIAGMHDSGSRVTIPGFYEEVRVLSEEERAELNRTPISDDEFRRIAGVSKLHGEEGYTTLERIGVRPTLEVNGLYSGFTGEGAKTVLPAKAMAKISMRLVPYQNPDTIEEGFREYVRRNAPPTVRWEIKKHSAVAAVLVNRNSYGMRAAVAAMEETFGMKPIFRFEGGTIPIVSYAKEKLNVDPVMMGYSSPDDNLHAPNEKFYLKNYHRGIEAYAKFLDLVSPGALNELTNAHTRPITESSYHP